MILDILCFLLGIHLSMMLVASLYRIIDLWYRISEFYGRVLGRILLVLLLNAIFVFGLDGSKQNALIMGQIFFLAFHIFIFLVGRTVLAIQALRKSTTRS